MFYVNSSSLLQTLSHNVVSRQVQKKVRVAINSLLHRAKPVIKERLRKLWWRVSDMAANLASQHAHLTLSPIDNDGSLKSRVREKTNKSRADKQEKKKKELPFTKISTQSAAVNASSSQQTHEKSSWLRRSSDSCVIFSGSVSFPFMLNNLNVESRSFIS